MRSEDTLYSIAWRHDLDYRDLARWNNIGADNRISVGQMLVLGPRAAQRTPHLHDRGAPLQAAVIGTAQWDWPTDRVGAPRAVAGGGMLIFGRLGQDVRAAIAGRVVYTGSALRGYGNLIIIKHADNLLSAYAHNREMLVREGQDIATGQLIAHMGEDASHAAVLYFEIRRNGKPIDARRMLPIK